MNASQAKKRFEVAINEVERFGVRITAEGDWGVLKTADDGWRAEDGHVCACGALVLACNPAMRGEASSWDSHTIIEMVQKVLRCTPGQAWAVSEGFEGDRLGGQQFRKSERSEQTWYRIGKNLRRHAE